MAPILCTLLPLLILAVALDLFLVTGLRRYRTLKKEKADSNGNVKISRRELLKNSFFPAASRKELRRTFQSNSTFRKRLGIVIELSLIAIWAMTVGTEYLNMNPRVIPGGNEFGSAIQSHHMWTQFQKCGLCALWNGFERGGYPAFADIQGSMLHPFVVATTLLWGVVNGVKISLVLALWSAGVAQWWLARELKLGWLPRMWSAGIAVAGGHLSGRMELGVFGVTLATAMGSLVFASILHVENNRTNRAAVLLGMISALAILSGQGYMQVGMIGMLPAMLFLLYQGNGKFVSHWKYYLLAAVIAFLLSAPLMVPLIRFSPNIAKYMDPEFQSVQPIQFFVLNLVIDDVNYYRTELLQKFPYPYLYSLYIGWIPVLLSVYGIARIKRDRMRIFGFLIAGIVLSFLVASAILLKPLSEIFPSLTGIRHPPQIAGLAVPLILALSAYGLDKLLNLRWPDLYMYFEKSKLQKGLFSLRWVLLIPLLLSLKSTYDFSQTWLYTTWRDPDIYKLLAILKTDSLQWVEPPFGEHAFVEPALEMDLKLSPGIMTWTWRDRPDPITFRYLSRIGQPIAPVTLKGSINGLNIYENSQGDYAQVDAGDDRYPCRAKGSGGTLYIYCNASEEGYLVLQEYTYAGWRAWRDGEPIPLVFDETWLKVQAPAGKHTYTFRYLPWDVLLGFVLAIFGLITSIYFWRTKQSDASP